MMPRDNQYIVYKYNVAAHLFGARPVYFPYVCKMPRIAAISVVFITLITISTVFAQFPETRQLTSNNVIALAGSGDTLWIATERGFNYRTSIAQDGWLGFEANDLFDRLWGLAFGGGGAAALLNNGNPTASDPIGFWYFDHAANRQRERYFRFSNRLRGENGDSPVPTGGVIHSDGSFWVPFGEGGLIRYNSSANSVSAIRPNDVNEISPQDLDALADTDKNTKTVLAVTIYEGDSLLVTTPSALWLYVPSNNYWNVLHTEPDVLHSENQPSFSSAFTLDNGGNKALLAFIGINNNESLHLYRLDSETGTWHRQTARSLAAIYPAVGRSFYSLLGENLGVTVDSINTNAMDGTTTITQPNDFRMMLAAAGDNASPEINDILFVPHSNGSETGTLLVATVTGLYMCASANPRSNEYDDFTLIRHVREVRRGQAYALPGIMRMSVGDRYDRSVFVYKLKKDGNVTIRVYDYNMSLVKTVVRNERRSANAERSTNPDRDFWDGTNNLGRRVWPGVYYFKITSTGGDRLLGKVILAK